jgi:hypothetical protein
MSFKSQKQIKVEQQQQEQEAVCSLGMLATLLLVSVTR